MDANIESMRQSASSPSRVTGNGTRLEAGTVVSTGEGAVRKIVCRYGRGCTHKLDPTHRERFWHPGVPEPTVEQLQTHYICYECAECFVNLKDLRQHLVEKTSWSNLNLVGCRICCLIDQKEWHEGVVSQFHKSGKHYIEFRTMSDKRWMQMSKVAFYITERPTQGADEVKEPESKANNDETFLYAEELTSDYAFAQSVLYKIYGTGVQETGHKTKGHICLTDEDKDCTRVVRGSLLYGELLPRGVNKALGSLHLNAATCRTLFDMGMGIGKVVIQAFLQFRNLEFVYGVELSSGRYAIAEESVVRMVALFGADAFTVERVPGESITIIEKPVEDGERCRILKMERGNMFDVNNVGMADILMLETDVPSEFHTDLCGMLSKLKEGARTLTYLDLRLIWPENSFCFRQVTINRSNTDRFPTSWSVQRGHHFFLWMVVPPEEGDVHLNNQIETTRSHSDILGFGSRLFDGSPNSSELKPGSSLTSNGVLNGIGTMGGKEKLGKVRKPRPILNFLRKLFSSSSSSSSAAATTTTATVSAKRNGAIRKTVDDGSSQNGSISYQEDRIGDNNVDIKFSCFPNLFRSQRRSVLSEADESQRVIPLNSTAEN